MALETQPTNCLDINNFANIHCGCFRDEHLGDGGSHGHIVAPNCTIYQKGPIVVSTETLNMTTRGTILTPPFS